LIDIFKTKANRRRNRRHHCETSRGIRSPRGVTPQPRTRSRKTFSARARSSVYSASEIVPAWRRSSRRKSVYFSASRLVPTAASTYARFALEVAADASEEDGGFFEAFAGGVAILSEAP